MWREIVLVVDGVEAESALESAVGAISGSRTVSDRQYHIGSAGGPVEFMFGVLDQQYDGGEFGRLRARVHQPRLLLVLYLDPAALSEVMDRLPVLDAFVDVEEPGSLDLVRWPQALERIKVR